MISHSRIKLMAMLVVSGFALTACNREQAPPPEYPPIEDPVADTTPTEDATTVVERQPPPESGPARDIQFPPVTRTTLRNGLEVNTVEWHQLPIVYINLVIKSGGETDPANIPGLSGIVADMLTEGTRGRSSVELAEHIEFLGADIWTDSGTETISIGFRALSEHLDEALAVVAEVATQPAFSATELNKLKQRELDRLNQEAQNPRYLSRREYYRAIYGNHPYARYDTTAEAIGRVNPIQLRQWHRRHVVANNAFLVVVGDVTSDQVQTQTQAAFGRWRRGTVPTPRYTAPPARTSREVIVVDRPGSAQSQIRIGNLAIPRSDESWIQMSVANQVLGGSASSRLFMDLRERRSLTYGAYSDVIPREQVGPFTAVAAVRTEVTVEALGAFFEHLDRISTERASDEELELARRYLSDSFPLHIDTPGKIAGLVGELRSYGLPDDYWDTFRTRIGEVTGEQALAAAQANIRPDESVVIIVGEASAFAEELRQWGPVTVVNTAGETTATYPALETPPPAAEAAAESEAPAAE